MLLFLGNPSQIRSMDDISVARIAAALEQVGPRLKRLRTQRNFTLTGVSTSTGISKSTLSRLETGQRRPTLELLLALSHAYRVPLDDLVAAPEEGDPRIAQARTCEGSDRASAHSAAGRHAGLEDRHPHHQGHPRTTRSRWTRMDLRPLRA